MITLVYPYYNNGGMLERQLAVWRQYPNPEQWSVILVDDGSQADPALPHLSPCGIDLSLYRVMVDIPWNQHGAKNLAMKHSQGWCVLSDIDHVLDVDSAAQVQRLLPDLRRGQTYWFNRRLTNGAKLRHAPNIWLMHADDYWKGGGYDEAFAGYYGTDKAFRNALEKALGRPEILPIEMTVYVPEDQADASTRGLGRQGTSQFVSSNPALMERMRKAPRPTSYLNFPWERVAWQPPQDS